MAPKIKLTAVEFQAKYGELVSAQYSHCLTARTLRNALAERTYPIIVTDGMLKVWFTSYRLPPGAVVVSSSEELHSKYGDWLPALAAQHPSAYRLSKILKERDPPMYVTDQTLKSWFSKYFDADPINSAGHLELKYGDRIREHPDAVNYEAADLRVWLRSALKVDASERTCQTWRMRSWSTSNRLMSMHDIEHSIGDRLRLLQYRQVFRDELYDNLVVTLSEGQPPVYLADPSLLRSWYSKYHPDSGPLRISSVAQLESLLGEELRLYYGHLKYWSLHTALQQRIKPVLLDRSLVKTWVQQNMPSVSLKRPAGVMKRPAVSLKRPASTMSVSDDVVMEPLLKRPSFSCNSITSAAGIEEACGERYRREVSDLGLGLQYRDMREKLLSWGYSVGEEACRIWLARYRLASKAKDGNTAVYASAKEDLQYWFHVEKLSPAALQQRYLHEHGVYAHRSNLLYWLQSPEQKLPRLDTNEGIHSHACGEYVIQELQQGKSAADVVDGLLKTYLVESTVQRVAAYRKYREQTGVYWTVPGYNY